MSLVNRRIIIVLRILLFLTSLFLLVMGIMGIIAQNGHITDLKLRASLNFGGLVSQIATIAAGILGIAASVEPNLWFIVSFMITVGVSMGFSIAGAVAIGNSWDSYISVSDLLEIDKDGSDESNKTETMFRDIFSSAYELAIVTAVVEIVAFISSLALGCVVYVTRNSASNLVEIHKRVAGQAYY